MQYFTCHPFEPHRFSIKLLHVLSIESISFSLSPLLIFFFFITNGRTWSRSWPSTSTPGSGAPTAPLWASRSRCQVTLAKTRAFSQSSCCGGHTPARGWHLACTGWFDSGGFFNWASGHHTPVYNIQPGYRPGCYCYRACNDGLFHFWGFWVDGLDFIIVDLEQLPAVLGVGARDGGPGKAAHGGHGRICGPEDQGRGPGDPEQAPRSWEDWDSEDMSQSPGGGIMHECVALVWGFLMYVFSVLEGVSSCVVVAQCRHLVV